MRHDPYLITYRKRRRRSSAGVPIVAAIIIAGLIAGGALFALARSGAAASMVPSVNDAPAAASAETLEQTATSVAQETTQTPQSASAVTTATPDSAAESPDEEVDRDDAVAEAALEFPGAPSVKPKSIAGLHPRHKYIAITLDDGYGFDSRLLALFKKYDARCTVFVLGQWAANNKKALRKLDKAGFEIANHSWDHSDLTELSDAEVRRELRRTQKVISAVTGNQAPYMRPPMGATNARVKEISGELGYRVIMWNRTFADTSPKASPERSYRSVMQRGGGVKPGDIVVGHMGSEDTYEALKRILPELKAQGYEFVTVSELIADSKKK